MSTSSLKPIISDDGSAFWFVCPSSSQPYFYLQNFASGVPLLVGSTKSSAVVSIVYEDSSELVLSFLKDGQVLEAVPSAQVAGVSISAPDGATVAITPKPDAQVAVSGVNTVNGAYLTAITSTTAMSNTGLTGSASVLAIGGGGGGGGGAWNAISNNCLNMGGGGGASGGIVASTINAIENTTATIGAAGNGGALYYAGSGANYYGYGSAGNAGGNTTIGNIAASGGPGGSGGYTNGSSTANDPGSAWGAGGAAVPGGAAGGNARRGREGVLWADYNAGSVTPTPVPSTSFFSYSSTASGNGAPGGVFFGWNTAIAGVSGNRGSSGGYNTASYTANAGTMNINAGSGYGYGGAGGIGVRIYNGGGGSGASQVTNGAAGGSGVLYIFKIPS